MLELRDFSVSIGRLPIVRDATLRLADRQFGGLIGANGAGKTTLMRGVMGALPMTGVLRFDGVELARAPAQQRVSVGIGYMPEDRRLVPDFTAEENILLPAWSARAADLRERLAWIYRLMPEVAKFRNRRSPELSGGQQKMVALARALMAGRRLLVLDEPFEGLAPALARRLAEVLKNLKSEGVTVLVSDSNEKHVEGLLDRSFRIERGVVQQAA